jgi:uncharacterized protein (DUF2267 family)
MKKVFHQSNIFTRNGDQTMNMNKLAQAITKNEGLKKQVDIAQVKEVLRVLAEGISADKNACQCFVNYVFKCKAPKVKKK